MNGVCVSQPFFFLEGVSINISIEQIWPSRVKASFLSFFSQQEFSLKAASTRVKKRDDCCIVTLVCVCFRCATCTRPKQEEVWRGNGGTLHQYTQHRGTAGGTCILSLLDSECVCVCLRVHLSLTVPWGVQVWSNEKHFCHRVTSSGAVWKSKRRSLMVTVLMLWSLWTWSNIELEGIQEKHRTTMLWSLWTWSNIELEGLQEKHRTTIEQP